MLILTRQANQSIVICKDIKLTVLGVEKGNVKFSISAPREVPVHREEVWRRIKEAQSGD